MSTISIRQILNLFYKELSIIKGAGFIFILTLSITSLMYLTGFIIELPKLQLTQGYVESISSHESYSSKYHGNKTYYEANIHFITQEGQAHTFKSFAIGRTNIGTDFTVLYRMDGSEGMKAYTIPELFLLGIFFIFIVIAPLPIYLMILNYFQKKIRKLEGKASSRSTYQTGMIVWFICIWLSIFGGGLIWTYYAGNMIFFIIGVVLMLIVGKSLMTSIRQIKNQ